jgi:heat shock protein 4
MFNEELKYIQAKCNNNQFITFELRHHGEQKTFTLEQLLAAYFCNLQKICENAGVKSTEVVISVPPYLSAVGRQTILDAAKIAKFNCHKLINETTAIGLFYGLFRSEEFINKLRYVMFVDMGYSKLTVTIMKFEVSKFTIVAQGWEANLGARNLDDAIAEKLIEDFKAKHGLDLKERPKAMIRLYEAVKRAREILSANKEIPIIVESIAEDEDIQCNLTREDFETLIAPYLESIRNLCMKVLEEAKVQVDVVEMVGETTRTPSIMKEIQSCVKMNISRTMNSADCIARGCAIQCAMLSSFFKVAKYDAVEYNALPVDLVCKLSKGKQTHRIFREGISFPIERVLRLQSKEPPIELQLTYPEQVIRTYKPLTDVHYSNFYIRIALDENMSAEVRGVEADDKEEHSDGEMEDDKSSEFKRMNSDCEEMTDINTKLLTVDRYMRQGTTGKKIITMQSSPFGLSEEQIK